MIPVFILSVFIAFGITKLYITQAIVPWDEAVYLRWAYLIYHALKTGNFTGLWHITRMQFDYPPLTSWTVGAPLVPFGFSVTSARTVGLVWFIAGAMLVYGIGKMLDRGKSQAVGIVSALLFMTSPLMIFSAVLVIKEMPGTALTLAVLFTYFVARKSGRFIWWLGSALCLIALCLTKYNYGGLAVIALCFEAGCHILGSGAKSRLRIIGRYMLLFGPAAVVTLWWVFTPVSKLPRFLSILQNATPWMGGYTTWWGHVIFYPYTILLMSGPSILTGVICLVSLVAAIFYLRDWRIRTLWILFTLNFVLGELHIENMQERYIVTTLPALFIISAYISVDIYSSVKKSIHSFVIMSVFWVILVLAGVKIVYDLCHLPQFVYSVGSFTAKLALFNERYTINQYFYYDDAVWAKTTWPDVRRQRPQDVVTYVISHVDLGKPVNVVGRSNELAPDYFTLMFDIARDNGTYPRLSYPSYTVTVDILPTSVYYTKNFLDWNTSGIPVIRQVEADPALTRLARRDFQELGVVVTIYVPKS